MEQSNAIVQSERLPRLIEQAAAALAQATTAAEVLEAVELADVAYSAAKMASRLAKAKEAHDTVRAACRKATADALIIGEQARCRLVDEYDAAQRRGEVARRSDGPAIRDDLVPNGDKIATVEDIGLTRKQIHEARFWRDAESANPGIIKRTLDALLADGKEPTRAELRRAIAPKPKPPPIVQPTTHTPAPPPREEEDDAEKVDPGVITFYPSISVAVIRLILERKGEEREDLINLKPLFELMCKFIENTLDCIDDGTLTATGDCPDEWDRLKVVMESVFSREG